MKLDDMLVVLGKVAVAVMAASVVFLVVSLCSYMGVLVWTEGCS